MRVPLNHLLHQERQASPIPSGALTLSSRPLLTLIDADSLSESKLIALLTHVYSAEPNARSVVAANRALPQLNAWLRDVPLSNAESAEREVEVLRAPPGADRADLLLAERALTLRTRKAYSALLIYTQDQGFVTIAQQWRRARLPSFVITLRDDASESALCAHYERWGVSSLALETLHPTLV